MDFAINIEQTENEYSNKEIFQKINILLTTVTLQVNGATKNLEIKNLLLFINTESSSFNNDIKLYMFIFFLLLLLKNWFYK